MPHGIAKKEKRKRKKREILTVYAPNNKVEEYVKQKLIKLKGEIDTYNTKLSLEILTFIPQQLIKQLDKKLPKIQKKPTIPSTNRL